MGYTVYKHTAPNGKVYIGITSQKATKRWDRGRGYLQNPHFYSAIQKYGWDNMTHEILEVNLSKEEACRKEIELIRKYKSNNREFGYNISTGGESGMYGTHHSEETKAKMREAHLGKPHISEEGKKRLREANKGKKHSPETRKKLSETHMGNQNRSRKVICVETLETFDSLKNAAKAKDILRTSIGNCLNGITKTAGGYHWEYYKD